MCHDLRRGEKARLRACADAEVQVVHAAENARYREEFKLFEQDAE